VKAYELTTLNHLPKSHWLLSRSEQDRARDVLLKWKKKNKDATIYHEMLVETLVRLHLIEQRLVNQTQFFSGETTDYRYIGKDRKSDISTEDAERKTREFDKYFFPVVKLKGEYLKLGLANSINLNITEDGSVQSLFDALADDERKKLDAYRRHAGRSGIGTNGTQEISTN